MHGVPGKNLPGLMSRLLYPFLEGDAVWQRGLDPQGRKSDASAQEGATQLYAQITAGKSSAPFLSGSGCNYRLEVLRTILSRKPRIA